MTDMAAASTPCLERMTRSALRDLEAKGESHKQIHRDLMIIYAESNRFHIMSKAHYHRHDEKAELIAESRRLLEMVYDGCLMYLLE